MAPKYKAVLVREQITYPVLQVTAGNDPCRSKDSCYHHALQCGHLITTLKPHEPCAPNCAQVATPKSATKSGKTSSITSELHFYCDACVEIANERVIAASLSNQEAERERANLRFKEAKRRDKANQYRKCYIAQKTVSVPCDEDGDAVKDYRPVVRGHIFDTALPRTGANMFEDIDPKCSNPSRRPRAIELMSDEEEEGQEEEEEEEEDDDDDEVSDDVDETVAEGMRWVRAGKERTAARPIVHSSPSTGLSTFITDNSDPSPAQARSKRAVASLQVPSRKESGTRRKRHAKETATGLDRLPTKKVKGVPRALKSVPAAGDSNGMRPSLSTNKRERTKVVRPKKAPLAGTALPKRSSKRS